MPFPLRHLPRYIHISFCQAGIRTGEIKSKSLMRFILVLTITAILGAPCLIGLGITGEVGIMVGGPDTQFLEDGIDLISLKGEVNRQHTSQL